MRIPPFPRRCASCCLIIKPPLDQLEALIAQSDARINEIREQHPVCQRLEEIPGVGRLISTAVVGTLGDGREFRRGREMASYLGLVPRQHATGGKMTLRGISKRGDGYLRMLLIQGGHAALRSAMLRTRRNEGEIEPRDEWVLGVASWHGLNGAAVAWDNKMARRTWAILTSGQSYNLPGLPNEV